MHIKIGKYFNWIGPYQLADKVFFWQNKFDENCPWADRAHKFGTWLSEGKDGNDSILLKVCTWIHSKRSREEYIHIDVWDTYSMDHTLSLIILPMLEQLQLTKHGAPCVDDEDVPEKLKSTSVSAKEQEYGVDDNHFKRWDWVINEMIWAFKQHNDDDAEGKFFTHPEKVRGENFNDAISRIKIDSVGLATWQKRKSNAFRLFGKYYQSLWD